MNYSVQLSSLAERKLERLPKQDRERIYRRLERLETDPFPRDRLKIEGSKNQGWRVRVGNYRVLYQVEKVEGIVWVYEIEWRDKACKERG